MTETEIMKMRPVSILCKRCNLRSHNFNDIDHKYCGRCSRWHDEPEDYELSFVDVIEAKPPTEIAPTGDSKEDQQ